MEKTLKTDKDRQTDREKKRLRIKLQRISVIINVDDSDDDN